MTDRKPIGAAVPRSRRLESRELLELGCLAASVVGTASVGALVVGGAFALFVMIGGGA